VSTRTSTITTPRFSINLSEGNNRLMRKERANMRRMRSNKCKPRNNSLLRSPMKSMKKELRLRTNTRRSFDKEI
jgi:hypothetical protein